VVEANNSSLISQLRSEIQYLREENQRKDTILLNMTETMKALTPSRELGGATEPPIKTEPLEPAEPADPVRSEPDREDPERATPEMVDPERPEREEPERPEREDPEREQPERVETEKVKPMPSEPREAASEPAEPRSVQSPGPIGLALQVLAQRLRRPQSAASGGGSSSGLGSRSLWRASGYRIVGWANAST
jgi:outer membrane biosynthesis protein TonB